MAKLTTNFNVDPYYDDYNEDKKFTRVLFKPGVAVQARELTQLQTMLQTQISRFGDNIYKEGTIIDGCAITFDTNYSFVKILDVDTAGTPVAPSTYIGLEARGSISNVYAKVTSYADGLVSQDPNLTTLYIDYTKTGVSEAKQFTNTENIAIYNGNTLIATVTAAGATVNNAVGDAFCVKVSEGVIYAKGHFLQVDSGQVLASKYSTVPSGVSIGFDVSEAIVNSDSDTSLLDNASGYNNENAPGADRLKLNPYLVAIPTGRALANSDFLSLIDFQAGLPVAKRVDTQFNSITNELAKRTRDESGNYTIDKNIFDTEDISGNTSHFNLLVGPGLHYVNGYRAEQFNTTRVAVEKSAVSANVADATITTNMGNYVIIDEHRGDFECQNLSEVSLRDTAQNAITDDDAVGASGAGAEIGKAHVRAIEYHQGVPGTSTGQFRLYLFNVRMNSGKRFQSVRSIYLSSKAHADIVLDASGNASIREPGNLLSLYSLNRVAVKETTDSEYTFRTSVSQNFTANTGTISVSTALPYSGTLTNIQKKDFIIIPSTTASGIGWVANQPLNTDNVAITVTGSSIALDFSSAIVTGSPNQSVKVIYNAKKTSAVPLTKTLKTVYVEIRTSNNVNGTTGPYSLGLPDVVEIANIYLVNTSASVNSTVESWASDVRSSFSLNTGQKDTFYGLSEIQKKPTLSLTSGEKLLVKAKVFQSAVPASGVGFYTVNSYKESDGVTAVAPAAIPIYNSTDLGFSVDLRNVLDCRPQVANTATFATTIGTQTINPAATLAFSGSEQFVVAPNKQFQTDIEYYLGRKDKIIVTEQGLLTVKKGIPSSKPVPPTDIPGGMTIGIMTVPPYPSLTSKEARLQTRKNEAIAITPINTKRYTMAEIGGLDKRLQNMEYYTTLSLLEQKTESMAVTDANGNDRFKNGILVDPATDFNVADISSREFRIGLDPSVGEFVPQFKSMFVPLKVANTSNVISVTHPGQNLGVFTLPGVETLIINQISATTAIPCTENFYKYAGKLELDPYYDGGYDTTVLPAHNVVNDQTVGINQLVENLNNIYPLTRTDVQKIGSTSSSQDAISTTVDTDVETWSHTYDWYDDLWWGPYGGIYGLGEGYGGSGGFYGYGGYFGHAYLPRNRYEYTSSGGVETTTTTTTTQTTTTITDTYQKSTQQLVTGSKTNTESLGDFVRDVSFSPFMKAQTIRIAGWGFKPNTRHYFYFDKKSIASYVRPGVSDRGLTNVEYSVLADPSKVRASGALGGAVTSDQYGHIFAVFEMPANTYFVGERTLAVVDVDDIEDINDATSHASTSFNAYNYSVTKQGVTVTTKSPTFDIKTTNEVFTQNTINTSTTVSTNVSVVHFVDDYDGNGYRYTANGLVVANTGGPDTSNTYIYPWDPSNLTSNTLVSLYGSSSLTTAGVGTISNNAITGPGGFNYYGGGMTEFTAQEILEGYGYPWGG